jgi:hypothetical protein
VRHPWFSRPSAPSPRTGSHLDPEGHGDRDPGPHEPDLPQHRHRNCSRHRLTNWRGTDGRPFQRRPSVDRLATPIGSVWGWAGAPNGPGRVLWRADDTAATPTGVTELVQSARLIASKDSLDTRSAFRAIGRLDAGDYSGGLPVIHAPTNRPGAIGCWGGLLSRLAASAPWPAWRRRRQRRSPVDRTSCVVTRPPGLR